MILSGRKKHTVRPARIRPLQVGQLLSLRVWTGLPYRSKQREFARAYVANVQAITITKNGAAIDHRSLSLGEQLQFALNDGFPGLRAMRLWFATVHGLPFTGQVIYFQLTH